jgi:hypothetical protein
MAVTADAVKTRFPTFEKFLDPAINALLQKVGAIDCPDTIWTEEVFRDEAILLCVAHFLTLELIQQAIVASITTGVTKGSPPSLSQFSGKNHWELTVYGLQFRDLQTTVPVSGFAFGGY